MCDIADTSWPARLERVCRNARISAAFQPIVDLAHGVVHGYEALSRFGEPGPAPQAWFAAAALHGFASRLEATALSVALAARARLPSGCLLFINLSPDALVSAEVASALAQPESLCGLVIEITEQTPVEDYAALGAVLDRLRTRGAMTAVDDTGAGYASLSHVLALRPEFVKLDRSLVAGIDRDPALAAAVRAISAFAGELGAQVVAEGVEHEAELEALLDLGLSLVQGFLLGRPHTEPRDLPAFVVRGQPA